MSRIAAVLVHLTDCQCPTPSNYSAIIRVALHQCLRGWTVSHKVDAQIVRCGSAPTCRNRKEQHNQTGHFRINVVQLELSSECIAIHNLLSN